MKTMSISVASILFLCLLSSAAVGQPAGGVFGYWANLTPSENDDHSNVTVPFIGKADEAEATTRVLQELSEADAEGVQAILFVSPFLFESAVDSNGNMKQNGNHTLDPSVPRQTLCNLLRV